ncbi:MAG TPA: sigma-70 family RNA polymerase sigma factor [Myxococcales bacterium]
MSDDSQIVGDLYRRYGPAVHRRLRSMLGDEQEALDLTQEVFLAFLDARKRLRGEASPFTVLYQIATHKAVDSLRRRARWSGSLGRLDYEEDAEEQAASADSDGSESSPRRVEAALDLALLTRDESPEVLTAAFMYFVERYTTEEIGEALGLSRKTIGKYLAGFAERARKRSEKLEARSGKKEDAR